MKASGSPFSIEVSRIRPQKSPGRTQYFSCVTHAVVFGLIDDVGLHADREIAGGRAALHGAPLVVLGRIAGRDADVDARPADRLPGRELQIRFLQRLDGVSPW